MGVKVDAAERMLDLVIALSHARHRMTKAQIRATVHGYGGQSSDEAFERMFERDKETLRTLGIPILTLVDAVHEDEIGYRIDTAAYELPTIDLSPAHLGVLSLAAQVWHDSAFAQSARRGLTKLRAVSSNADVPDSGVALRLRGPEDAIGEILEAVVDRVPVRFSYRAASSGQVTERTVEPWRVYARDHGWYLVGFDRDRGAQRSFRTSRIIGSVTRLGQPGEVDIPQQQLPTPERELHTRVQLAVRPEGAAALRARGQVTGERVTAVGTRDILELDVTDVVELADEIAGYGDTVIVLEPPQLRQAVLQRLRAVANLGGSDD